MGVYINMEMPEHCGECKLKATYDDETFCPFFADNVEYWIAAGRRHEDCPLVPVPPHYDLIDHNALKIAVVNGDCETRIDFLKHTMDFINKAPVVIPSDMPTYEAWEGE